MPDRARPRNRLPLHIGLFVLTLITATLAGAESYASFISEFGRRIADNSGQGSDHGAGNTMLVIGGSVKGGIYGTAADLNPYAGNPTLEASGGDVRHEFDFRALYATVADRWLQTDSAALLQGSFRDNRLGFLG